MSTSAIDPPPSSSDHRKLQPKTLPLIDLRLLSQSELQILTLSSPSSAELSLSSPSSDIVLPSIDRAVFNESAGSRKQTYSRLRLAPRGSDLSSIGIDSKNPRLDRTEKGDDKVEDRKIVELIRSLFDKDNVDDSSVDRLVSVRIRDVDSAPQSSNVVLQPDVENSSVNRLVSARVEDGDVGSDLGGRVKRKRGRKQKVKTDNDMILSGNEDGVVKSLKSEGLDREIVNKNRVVVVCGLGKMDSDIIFGENEDGGIKSKDHFKKIIHKRCVDMVCDLGEGVKKKRGKKPNVKMVNDMIFYEIGDEGVKSEDLDSEILNKNGVVVDFSALAKMEDPYGDELRKKTEGLVTKADFWGFLEGMVGQWGSSHKKRRIVAASDFGDALPKGWKLILFIKRKDGICWLICRQYISPSGREFVSCKEISSYLLSLCRPQDANALDQSNDNNHLEISGSDMLKVNGDEGVKSEDFDQEIVNKNCVDMVCGLGVGVKKKRGRKPKVKTVSDMILGENEGVSSEDPDKEIVNKNGVVVDFLVLARMEDPYGDELRRKTEVLVTEDDLLGFLGGLVGHWRSRRKKTRIVAASDFGDVLPKGWKLILSIKKKDGLCWLICRRYTSPGGREFVSCKEISSYLLSLCQPQDANALDQSDDNNHVALEISGSDMQQASGLSLLNYQNQGGAQVKGALKCHKCTMRFDERDDLLHHDFSSHKKSGKRRRRDTCVIDGVIIKDGIFECQFCHKTFNEINRYTGHVGIHVRNFETNLETSSKSTSYGKETPFTLLKYQNQEEGQVKGALKCPLCTMTFEERDAFLHHNFSSHKKSGKRRKQGTCVSDGVIIKDGIFECQFCHKTFSERHRYNSHVGIHMKNFVKNLEMSSKSTDPVSASEDPPIVTGMQFTILSSTDTIPNPYNGTASDCPSSGSHHNNLKSGSVSESCIKEYNNKPHFLPQIGHDMVNDKSCEPHVNKMMIDNKQCKAGGSAVICADQMNLVSSLQTSLSTNQSNNLWEEFDEHTLRNHTANKASFGEDKHPMQDLGSEGCSHIPNLNKRTCSTDNNAENLPFNTIEELKTDLPNQFGNNGTSIVLEGRYTGMNAHVASELKQQESSAENEFGSFVTEAKGNVVNDSAGNLFSNIVDSKEENDFERSLLHPPSDRQACRVSTNFEKINNSGIEEPTIDFGINSVRPVEDTDNSYEQDRCSEKGPSFIPFKHQNIVDNLDASASADTIVSPSIIEQHEFDVIKNCENSELIFGGNHSGGNVHAWNIFERKGSEKYSFLQPRNEQRYVVHNNFVNPCNNSMESLNQVGLSESRLFNPSFNQQNNGVKKLHTFTGENSKSDVIRNSESNEVKTVLGNSQVRLDVNRNFEGHSSLYSGNENPFGVQNNVNAIADNILQGQRQESGFRNSLFGHFGNGQLFDIENNAKNIYTGTEWEGDKLRTVDYARNNDMMIDFGRNLGRPVVAESVWKNDEKNVMQSGLPDASVHMAQSSSCFTRFDKNIHELFSGNAKFDGISEFERVQPASMGQMEYNFFTRQTNSLAENSKVLSYDAGMEQPFHSSPWLGQETMLSKTASRNHQFTSTCFWCRNEFHHEACNSGTQTGSIGPRCPTCKDKMSGQLNVL